MKIRLVNAYCPVVIFLAIGFLSSPGIAADKLIGIHSARTMSQSMPWIADEVGLFKKYDLEFQLVFISSAAMVTAAMLSGDGEVAITGGESITRAFAQGVTELIFIASAKNTLTHSILGKPEIKTPEDLKGKKLGLTRLGSNSHYFVIQALRKYGMGPTDLGPGLPLRRIWAGPSYSFCCSDLGGAPLLDTHARAGHRKVCARYGGGGEDHVHG